MKLFNMGTDKLKGLQLFLRDDMRFKFRPLEIVDTFLVERQNEQIVRGWKHFYKNQYEFAGYRGIPSGMVTLSFARDIILDPHGLVPERERPEKYAVEIGKTKSDRGIIAWLVDVGNAQRLKIIAKRGKNNTYDKIVIFLGIIGVLEIIVIGISLITK